MVVVMADAGYQFVISVIFVMVKRDFDYCQWFGSYGLGLVNDEVVEFGLSKGLVVNFLKLAALREKIGLTQKQLGDLVGVDTSTIRNWEYGKGSETFAKVARLCKVLECDIEDLFEEEAV